MIDIRDYIKSISEKKSDRLERRKQAKIHSELAVAAIKDADLSAVQAVLAKWNDYNDAQIKKIAVAAIESGDLEIFECVFSEVLKGDPNYTLHSHFGAAGGMSYIHEEQPLLYQALKSGKEEVALYLVNHPIIDLTRTGNSETIRCKDGGFCGSGKLESVKVTYPDLLALAEKKKMHDVIAAMARKQMYVSKAA